jgi:hypothetical protein
VAQRSRRTSTARRGGTKVIRKDNEGIIPVLARSVREVEQAAERGKVAPHGGGGVFLYQQRGRGMAAQQRQHPLANTRGALPFGHLARDIGKAAPAGLKRKDSGCLPHCPY